MKALLFQLDEEKISCYLPSVGFVCLWVFFPPIPQLDLFALSLIFFLWQRIFGDQGCLSLDADSYVVIKLC